MDITRPQPAALLCAMSQVDSKQCREALAAKQSTAMLAQSLDTHLRDLEKLDYRSDPPKGLMKQLELFTRRLMSLPCTPANLQALQSLHYAWRAIRPTSADGTPRVPYTQPVDLSHVPRTVPLAPPDSDTLTKLANDGFLRPCDAYFAMALCDMLPRSANGAVSGIPQVRVRIPSLGEFAADPARVARMAHDQPTRGWGFLTLADGHYLLGDDDQGRGLGMTQLVPAAELVLDDWIASGIKPLQHVVQPGRMSAV